MTTENSEGKARAVGINHVALEVGNIDEALEFYFPWLGLDPPSSDGQLQHGDKSYDL